VLPSDFICISGEVLCIQKKGAKRPKFAKGTKVLKPAWLGHDGTSY
jgi:hypothetical protein